MKARAKAGSENFDAITRFCLERFDSGQGVTIERNDKKIFIIPEHALHDKGLGLVITYEGGGCYVYSGDKELNEYVLKQYGFPLQVGIEVSKIVNALITQYGLLRKSDANIDLLEPNHDKGEKHG